MANFIGAAVLLAILGLAAGYIYKSKKNGVKCIGCPNGCKCSSSSGCGGNCSSCAGCSSAQH